MLRNMKLIVLVLLGCLSMLACGQKGPLYKTPTVQDNQSQQKEKPVEAAEANQNKD